MISVVLEILFLLDSITFLLMYNFLTNQIKLFVYKNEMYLIYDKEFVQNGKLHFFHNPKLLIASIIKNT